MAENQQTTTLVYKVDEASISNAQSRLQSLNKQQETFSAALLKGDIDADKYAKSIGRLAKEQQTLEQALKKTETAEKAVADELDRLKRAADIDKAVKSALAFEKKTKDNSAAVKQLTEDLRKMGATASESQGAAGKFAGAGRGFDLGQFGRNLKSAPAVPIGFGGLTTEPISKLLIGLDQMGVSIGALGVAAPIAVVALGAMALAFAKFTADAQKQADRLNAIIDAKRDVREDVARGLTTNEADARQEEINRLRQVEAQTLAELKAQYEQQITAQDDLFETVLRLTPQEEALEQQIQKSEAAIVSYNTQEAQLLSAREEGALAANDAAIAEKELLAARTQGILAAGQEAATLEQTRQQTEGKTKEELQALIAAEADRVAVLQAELAVLQASGDQSKEVTDRIAALQSQLELSAKKSDIFKGSVGSAMTNAEKSAADAAKKLAEEAKVNNQLGQSASKAVSGLRTLGQGLNRSAPAQKTGNYNIFDEYKKMRSNKPAEKAVDDSQKAADDYQKKLTDINRDIAMTFNDIGRDLQDSLEDLNIDTSRDIRDALAEGDFLSIGDIQRKARDDRADLEREAGRDRRDAQIKANQELLDLQAQFWQASISMAQGAIAKISGGTGQKQGSFVSFATKS